LLDQGLRLDRTEEAHATPLRNDELSKRIIGEQVYLRELTIADASQEYCDWLNDSETNAYLETRQSTIEELKAYIQKRVDHPNSFFVGIFDKGNDAHVGNIKLEPIDWENKKATFGILIGNGDYRGRGIGTEATKLIVDYAFDKMGLDEVDLGVIDKNRAAIRCYEKVGFKVTGVKKNAISHDGVPFDDVLMSIRKEDR
jgi:RimJ/RimL family protein N-acetyltransferase